MKIYNVEVCHDQQKSCTTLNQLLLTWQTDVILTGI